MIYKYKQFSGSKNSLPKYSCVCKLICVADRGKLLTICTRILEDAVRKIQPRGNNRQVDIKKEQKFLLAKL